MLYIKAQAKLIQYNFGFPNSFISHLVSQLSRSLKFLGFTDLGIFLFLSTIVVSFQAFSKSFQACHFPLMADTAATNTSTTESSSSSQDSYNLNDPLFLHPGENPGTLLTSQPLIGEENYFAWARSVRKSLIGQNKLGFIDGSITISSPLVNSPTAIQAWIRADNIVGTWIINSVSPKLQGSIIYRDTAFEIWTELRDTFSQGNGTKV